MGSVKVLDKVTFSEMIAASTLPVAVDFWAEWCGPCKAIAPVLDQLAEEHADKIVFAKINIDDHPEVAQQYGVQSIPTLLVFRDGVVAQRLIGAKPKAALAAELGLTVNQ